MTTSSKMNGRYVIIGKSFVKLDNSTALLLPVASARWRRNLVGSLLKKEKLVYRYGTGTKKNCRGSGTWQN